MIQAIDIIRAVEIVRNRCNIVPTELRERLAAPASSVEPSTGSLSFGRAA